MFTAHQRYDDEPGKGEEVGQGPGQDEELGPVLADESNLPGNGPNDCDELRGRIS